MTAMRLRGARLYGGLRHKLAPQRKLYRKLENLGCSRKDYHTLSGMSLEELSDLLREVATGGAPRFAFLDTADVDATSICRLATGRDATLAMKRQRLFSGQLVQFLFLRLIDSLTQGEFERRIEIDGWPHIAENGVQGRPAVFVGSHFGLAHCTPLILARYGLAMTSIVPRDFMPLLGIARAERVQRIELAGNFDLRVLAAAGEALSAGRSLHSTGDGLRGGKKNLYRFLDEERPFTGSFPVLAIHAGVPCMPVFLRTDEHGRLQLQICGPLDGGNEDRPVGERVDGMLRQYIAILEDKWRSDFGNVPARSLGLHARGWQKERQVRA